MKDKYYGSVTQTVVEGEIDRHVEEISVKGYSIVEDLFDDASLASLRQRIDRVYAQQEERFGRQELAAIQETDLCRAPLLYDFSLIELARHPQVLAIVERLLGNWFILNLQNAIINRPGVDHHQGAWHRDLPHQNFVISQPLAINALFAIDEFSSHSGATCVMPFSHKSEYLPSDRYIENNQLSVTMPAGAAVVFDAMLFHRAGTNTGDSVRRAVNHLYTKPIIKQQYDFPRAIADKDDIDPATARLLGFTSQVPLDDNAWRLARARKMNNP